MRNLHPQLPVILGLLAIAAIAAWSVDEPGALAQQGSKGTDAAGAYDLKASAVIAGRPDVEPASAAPSAGTKQKLKGGGTQRAKSRKGRPGPNMRANELGSSDFAYSVDKNFPQGPPPPGQEYVRIGVTIWRFSPSQCPLEDCPTPTANSKSLVDTATRIEDNLPLSTGERVRLGIESLSRSAFIYVIDREQFADGTLGDAYLIFPTRNINGGKNVAQPGLQVQLPRADGCFCVKSRNPQKPLVADQLVVVVSPLSLLPPKLAGYVRRAEQTITYRGSLQGGRALKQTPQEAQAGTKGLFDTASVLTRNDLPPQNFYQSTVSVGEAAVFRLSLRYK